MVAVMSAMFLAALDQSIVGTALPKIVSDFNGLNKLSWVVTAYLLTSTITVPIAGKLSDIFGRRKMISIGIVSFVVGSMLTGVSWNMTSLIFFRALQGIGGGILFSNAFAIIGDLFAPAERAGVGDAEFDQYLDGAADAPEPGQPFHGHLLQRGTDQRAGEPSDHVGGQAGRDAAGQ